MINITDLKEQLQNPSQNLYVTPGTSAQIIGAQDGSFPAFGHHVANEMGGVWTHPIKLLDGFWLELGVNGKEKQWLKKANSFTNYACYNTHDYHLDDVHITRLQFAPKDLPGVIVKYTFENQTDETLTISSRLVARADLSPVWYSDERGIVSGLDKGRIDEKNGHIIAYNDLNNWYAYMGVTGVSVKANVGQMRGFDETFGEGISGEWTFELTVDKNESVDVYFKVVGSVTTLDDAVKTMDAFKEEARLFETLQTHYDTVITTANIKIPDLELMKQYAWVKCHMEWLTTDVPGVGRGLTAGNPEYVWWFGCDSAYALAGCFPTGFHKLAEDTLDTVAKLSLEHNGNGRIIHEANTFGHVSNPGNTQETAHFIYCLYELFKWTGNKKWLEKHYPLVKMGINWLLEEMEADGDLFPEGYGIMEVKGLNGELIDTAVFTAMALKNAATMGKLLGEEVQAEIYAQQSTQLISKIVTEMWLEEEGIFADIRIPAGVLYEKLDDFIWQVNHYKSASDAHLIPYYENMKTMLENQGLTKSKVDTAWCFKNWVVNLPLEMKLASPEQAERALMRLNSEEFVGEYGMYVSGLEQTRMMTISTGSLIHANLAYGKTDAAYEQMKRLMKTFGMYLPGSISEMSPDYGCFVQAWTSYAILSPVVTGFCGIKPDAYEKKVTIAPQLPTDWHEMEISEVKIGNNVINVSVVRTNGATETENDGYHVTVVTKEKDWEFIGVDEVL